MYGQFKKEISTFLCNMEGIDLQGLPGKWQKSDHNAGSIICSLAVASS
jgi:hypothetical protein